MNTFPHSGEPSATPDGYDVLDLVAGAFDAAHGAPSLEQITARGTTLHRRRAALPAAAAVLAVGAVAGAAALLPFGGAGQHGDSAAAAPSSTATITDPDWILAPNPTGGYTLRILKPGDVAKLNAALGKRGVDVRIDEFADGPANSCSPHVTTTPTMVPLNKPGDPHSLDISDLAPGLWYAVGPASPGSGGATPFVWYSGAGPQTGAHATWLPTAPPECAP